MSKGIYKRTADMQTGKYKRIPDMQTGKYKRTPEMKTGKYDKTEEHKKKISKALKGIKKPFIKRKKRPPIKDLLNYKNTRRGDKCNFWKGGISKKYKQGYSTYKYRTWRMEVFERDNFTCQFCKIRGCYITAHHIKAWAYYPKLRYEVSNGVTLCEECHKLTDNYKGRGKRNESLSQR